MDDFVVGSSSSLQNLGLLFGSWNAFPKNSELCDDRCTFGRNDVDDSGHAPVYHRLDLRTGPIHEVTWAFGVLAVATRRVTRAKFAPSVVHHVNLSYLEKIATNQASHAFGAPLTFFSGGQHLEDDAKANDGSISDPTLSSGQAWGSPRATPLDRATPPFEGISQDGKPFK